MIGFIWWLGSMVAYFAVGFAVAAWDMPSLHQRIKDDPEHKSDSWQKRAGEARFVAYMTVLVWPLRGPYLAVARLTDKYNPDLIQRELARREQEVWDREQAIKKLEQLNEIGQNEQRRTAPPSPNSLRPQWWKDLHGWTDDNGWKDDPREW